MGLLESIMRMVPEHAGPAPRTGVSSAAEEPPIFLDDLVRTFGDIRAVDRLSFSVAPGIVCGLLGRNGAGKTTALRILTTLLLPTSGTARVCGFDVARRPTAVRRVIGYVPQAISADAELTAYENLLLAAQLYDVPQRVRQGRIDGALRVAGLEQSAGRLVRTFSGGMIRSLEIAQSTLHEPRVLFLDEPTVGLDPVARQTVWQHIRLMRERQRCTVLLTTHHMDEAELLCDEVAIMHRGRLVANGAPAMLRHALRPAATLDDVFAHYTEGGVEADGGYRQTSATRHVADRLG